MDDIAKKIAEVKKATGGVAHLFDENGDYNPFLDSMLRSLESKYKESGNLETALQEINSKDDGLYFFTKPIDRVFSTKNEHTQFLTYIGMATAGNKRVVVLSGADTIEEYFVERTYKFQDLKEWEGKFIPAVSLADQKFARDALIEYGIPLINPDMPVIITDKDGAARLRVSENKPHKLTYHNDTSFAWAAELKQ